MRKVIWELCALLEEQKGILETMLKLSQEEREVIISADTERLSRIVRLEMKELTKLNQVEKRRTALHEQIAAELSLSDEELIVSVIAERAQPDEREALLALQESLTELVSKHRVINTENKELLRGHLEYTELMMELLNPPDDPLNNFYGGDGRAAPDRPKSTGFFSGQA